MGREGRKKGRKEKEREGRRDREEKEEGRSKGRNSFLSDAFIQSQTVRRDTRMRSESP